MDLEYTISIQKEQGQANLATIERGFAAADKTAEELNQTLGDQATQLSIVERAAKAAGLSVEAYRKREKDAIDGVVNSYRQAKAATESASDATRKATDTTKTYGDSVEDLGEKKKKAKSATEELKDKIVGLVGAGAMLSAIKAAAEYAGQLDNMHKSSGLSITFLQKASAAAKANGSDISQVVGVYGKFQDALIGGDKSVVTALGKLGLSMDALRALSPDQQMRILAQAVSAVEDPTLKANIATDLLGATGRSLIPTLADVASQYDQLPALAEDTVRATAALGNSWDNLKSTGVIVMTQVLGPLGQGLDYLAQQFGASRFQASDLTNVLPFLQATFQGLLVEVYKVAKGIVDMGVASGDLMERIPGAGLIVGGLTEKTARYREQSQWLGETIKGLEADLAAQWDTLRNGRKPTDDLAKATAVVVDRYAEAKRAFASLTPEQKLAIDRSRELGDSMKEQAAAGKTTEDVVRLYTTSLKDATKATREHERELAKLAENKASKEMALLAKDVQAAYDKGNTAKEIYDQLGKRLLEAGRQAEFFRMNAEKIGPVLQTTIDAAREFKIAEILARANQDMAKEFQRVLKEMNAERAKIREGEERAQYESNQKVLAYYQEAEDAKAQASRDRAQGTARESQAEADFKIYQLDRWRQQELGALNTSSQDYALLAGQIEEIYAVRLQGVMDEYARTHQTFWQGLKQRAGDIYQGVVSTVSDGFASMLTRAQTFKDGFVGIWNSIRSTFTDILADMLDYYLKKFIARLVLGMGGSGGGITGTILNAAGLSGGGGGVTGGLQQQGTNWLLQAMGLGGASTIGGVTSLAGTAAVMPGLASGGLGAAGAGLSSSSLAGVSGTMPALTSVTPGASTGVGAGIGLAGGLATGGIGLGLGLLGTQLFGGSGWSASGFGAGSGALVGLAIGGPIGAAIGGLAGFVGGWIGKSVGEKINDARDELLAKFGGAGTGEGSGYASVNDDLARMDRLGMDGTEARRLIFRPKDWDDYNAGVTRLQAALNDLRFVQDKVSESYTTLQQRGREAMDQGASEVEVLKAQSAGYSEIYNTIIRTGAEAPAGFEPVAEKLLEMGVLLDANSQKVENLFALYANSATHLVSKTQDVTEAFTGLQNQQDTLIAQGLQHEDVLKIQAGGYSLLVDRIRDMGGTAPEAMRPVLDELLQMGLLVDASGSKVTDLGGLFRATGDEGALAAQRIAEELAIATASGTATEDQINELQMALAIANQETARGTQRWQEYADKGVLVGSRVTDSLRLAADSARTTVSDIEDAFRRFDPPQLRIPYMLEGPSPSDAASYASGGGLVTARGVQYLAGGGTVLPFLPRLTDTVPAMLTPGEGVISRRGMRALGAINRGDVGGETIVIEAGAIVVNGAADPDAVADRVMRRLEQRIKVQKRRRAA